jgi:hypothetical protein
MLQINNKPQFTDKFIKRLLENGFDFLSENVVFLFGFMRVKAYSVYNPINIPFPPLAFSYVPKRGFSST